MVLEKKEDNGHGIMRSRKRKHFLACTLFLALTMFPVILCRVFYRNKSESSPTQVVCAEVQKTKRDHISQSSATM